MVCPAGHILNVLTDSLPIFFSFLYKVDKEISLSACRGRNGCPVRARDQYLLAKGDRTEMRSTVSYPIALDVPGGYTRGC